MRRWVTYPACAITGWNIEPTVQWFVLATAMVLLCTAFVWLDEREGLYR